MVNKEMSYTLHFRTPVSVFTGLGIAGLVDRTVMRDSEHLPCIPGSTVKGRWRFFAERLLRGAGLPEGLTIHSANDPRCKHLETACTLCRLFGNPAVPALLLVGQGELLDKEPFLDLLKDSRNPVVYPDAEIRPGIAISRKRRAALGDHLFFDEAIAPVRFGGSVQFRDLPRPGEMECLQAAGRLVDALGARKAAGRGALEGGIILGPRSHGQK